MKKKHKPKETNIKKLLVYLTKLNKEKKYAETLKFFKTNKPIKPGEILKKSDLNGSLLVKAGSNTEVIIENQLLKLKTTGISRNSGIYGDQVEVLNIQKNKKYVGKIIDINKIQVEI
jgi:flagella basal body P-ring formation protein FlgA